MSLDRLPNEPINFTLQSLVADGHPESAAAFAQPCWRLSHVVGITVLEHAARVDQREGQEALF